MYVFMCLMRPICPIAFCILYFASSSYPYYAFRILHFSPIRPIAFAFVLCVLSYCVFDPCVLFFAFYTKKHKVSFVFFAFVLCVLLVLLHLTYLPYPSYAFCI